MPISDSNSKNAELDRSMDILNRSLLQTDRIALQKLDQFPYRDLPPRDSEDARKPWRWNPIMNRYCTVQAWNNAVIQRKEARLFMRASNNRRWPNGEPLDRTTYNVWFGLYQRLRKAIHLPAAVMPAPWNSNIAAAAAVPVSNSNSAAVELGMHMDDNIDFDSIEIAADGNENHENENSEMDVAFGELNENDNDLSAEIDSDMIVEVNDQDESAELELLERAPRKLFIRNSAAAEEFAKLSVQSMRNAFQLSEEAASSMLKTVRCYRGMLLDTRPMDADGEKLKYAPISMKTVTAHIERQHTNVSDFDTYAVCEKCGQMKKFDYDNPDRADESKQYVAVTDMVCCDQLLCPRANIPSARPSKLNKMPKRIVPYRSVQNTLSLQFARAGFMEKVFKCFDNQPHNNLLSAVWDGQLWRDLTTTTVSEFMETEGPWHADIDNAQASAPAPDRDMEMDSAAASSSASAGCQH